MKTFYQLRSCMWILSFAAVIAAGPPVGAADEGDSAELKSMFDADQGDRRPLDGKPIDWKLVGPRDAARERRVKELVMNGELRTGADFFHAAMILQHAQSPDDYLLAHDLCVIAIDRGEKRAKWLAAASLDRFLLSVGRLQRFGTQFGGETGSPMKLRPVDPAVPDALRRELNVPPLAAAQAREAKFAEEFAAKKGAAASTEPGAPQQ